MSSSDKFKTESDLRLEAMRKVWEALGNTDWEELYWTEPPYTAIERKKVLDQLEAVVDAVQDTFKKN